MNVGQLRAMIADLPEEMIVLKPASDHRYSHAHASVTFADKVLSQWFEVDDDSVVEVKVERVLVIT